MTTEPTSFLLRNMARPKSRRKEGNMQCDMSKDCHGTVTHIGEKGYIYCAEHADTRRRYVGEHCRKMRPWELSLVLAGKPLPTYRRISKREAMARVNG